MEYITAKEASTRFKRSESNFLYLEKKGLIKKKLIEGRLYFSLADLEAYYASKKAPKPASIKKRAYRKRQSVITMPLHGELGEALPEDPNQPRAASSEVAFLLGIINGATERLMILLNYQQK